MSRTLRRSEEPEVPPEPVGECPQCLDAKEYPDFGRWHRCPECHQEGCEDCLPGGSKHRCPECTAIDE